MFTFFLFVTAACAFLVVLAYRLSYRLKSVDNRQICRYVSIGSICSMYIAWLIVFVSQIQDIYVPDFGTDKKAA